MIAERRLYRIAGVMRSAKKTTICRWRKSENYLAYARAADIRPRSKP